MPCFFRGTSEVLRHMETGFLRFFPEAIVWMAQGLVLTVLVRSGGRGPVVLTFLLLCFFLPEKPRWF